MRHIDESLQASLEDVEAGVSVAQVLERHANADTREALRPLLAVAERYREAPEVLPSLEFRQAARARMLGMIAAQPKARRQPIAWPPRLSCLWPAHLARVVAAVLAVLLLTVGGGTAALASPPSSPLFGARLALEQAEVLVTPDAGARLELRLEIGDRRAGELEVVASTANPGEIALAAQRYEAALRGEVDEAAAAPEVELPLVDQRLASQEEALLRAVLAAGASPGTEKSVEEALASIARERSRLRERSGWDAATPLPEASPNQSAGAEATPTLSPTATPEPSPTAPADATGSPSVGQDQGRQERAGWDQPSATVPAGGCPTPISSTPGSSQERTGKQRPTSPSTSPTPTAATSSTKPGGQVGPGPSGRQPVATPSGPGSSPGGSGGTGGGAQSGTSGGKSGR